MNHQKNMPEEKDQNTNLNNPQTPPSEDAVVPPAPPRQPKPQLRQERESGFRPDVANALKGLRLPERKSFRAQADAPPSTPPKEKEPDQVASVVKPLSEQDIEAAKITEEKAPFLKSESASNIVSLRTFKDDLQKLLRTQKISLVRAATLENEKRRTQEKVKTKTSPVRKKQRMRAVLIFITIAVLSTLSVLAIGAIVLIQAQREQSIDVPEDDSLMFAEQSFAFPLEDLPARTIKRRLEQARGDLTSTLGSVTRIVPTMVDVLPESGQQFERPATANEFLNAIGADVPEDVSRFLSNDFFLGIHTIDENAPVLVFVTGSYERAFPGMLEWEDTLNDDLTPFFTFVPPETRAADGTLALSLFEDVIIRNFDARALRDTSGNIKMLYSFPSRNILIIAESPNTFAEALARLRAERRL